MNNAFLVTRPNHDLITTYLFHWTTFVLTVATKKGIKILDLKGKKATSKNFASYIKKHEPKLVFFNGHGTENIITGYNDEILIEANKNEKLLTKKIIYARSCDAANNLGFTCIKNNTSAFIGYRRKYALCYLQSKISKPLNDEVARLFLEPSNLVPISLLKGNTAKNAHRKSQDAMTRNFRFMLSTKASQSQKDASPYLWSNRKYQTLLGSKEAHI